MSSSRIRKFESGSDKLKRKKRIEKLISSQRGALDKFVRKDTLQNQNVDDICDDVNVDGAYVNANNVESNDVNAGSIDANVDVMSVDVEPSNNQENDVEKSDRIDIDEFHTLNIYDPRYWDSLDLKNIDILVSKGLKRDFSIRKGPKDKYSRSFSADFYTRYLPNGEKYDRDWLVYSKELDKVFCFCCKVFKKGNIRGHLVSDGFSDWAHLGVRLKEHENSVEHFKNMTTWYELRLRLETDQVIDKVAHTQLEKEKEHWRKVLLRIFSMVKFLAKHGLAFRGSNERLYQDSNGNFLGLIEMLAEFDPIIQEHVQRITNDQIHFHYLGKKIQNELILLFASNIKRKIIKEIEEAKYFSIILDCTPDVSHQEQMSLILRYVDVSSNDVSIKESFLGFLEVNDTTGQGLFDVLQNELLSLGLNIDDVRGQSYDNGSNMKGKNIGVQRLLLDVNPRAFHTSCASHSLNLALCDMANACGKARDFFGIVQRIYTIFANSTKRWQIFKDNVKETVKSLSSTRWESREKSVRAIRFQIMEIREALLQVADSDNDSKIRSEAGSLAKNELGDFEFIVSLVIWYDVLYAVNLVSKYLQKFDMLIGDAIVKITDLISFFKKYRESGFENALVVAEEIAMKLDINPIFPQKRKIQRKKQFDEARDDPPTKPKTPAEIFKRDYFLYIVNQAEMSLTTRFEQYKEYECNFGFLFTSKKLQSLDDMSLQTFCSNIELALRKDKQSDIDGNELYMELRMLQEFLPKELMQPIDILKYLKRHSFFPNAIIVYRIMLTLPVTVASAERSFSKLKLLKSYLRSTMTQERLNGLALMSIEKDFLETLDYE